MSIWIEPIDLGVVNERSRGTLAELLKIEFVDISDNSLTARMPITPHVHQPLGIMHGGASCVLAETVGSTAANYCVDQSTHYCVGLDINTNHIRSIRGGFVLAMATPYHRGRSTQVWHIEIVNEHSKIISINRLTMAVLSRHAESA
ncbi:MAG: esterase [Gammaproteobacteria bacterium RIFCSPHIGHO2_12_FULL_45_9]|nr:MAG: esterase [Gammaproteobacteria bacterium RIFCSPHIGHO2_12_FULL_45_9]